MPEQKTTVQQRFEQLPDAEAPFGLDTRIKAHAHAQLEQQQSMHRKRKHWGTGLATAACAVLAVFLGKQLLQLPSHQLGEHKIQQQSDEIFEESSLADTAIVPLSPTAATAKKSSSLPRSMSSGNTVQNTSSRADDSDAVRLERFSNAPEAAMESLVEPVQMKSREAHGADQLLSLEAMLEELELLQQQGDQEEISSWLERIKKHYPEYSPPKQLLN